MITRKDRAILSFALAVLFAGGAAGGYFYGKRSAAGSSAGGGQRDGAGLSLTGSGSGAGSGGPVSSAAASPAEWRGRALERLGADLRLNAEQLRDIAPMLEHAGDKMFLNRDRALFQIQLELLAFHEALASRPGLLAPAQQERLNGLRARLQQRIGEQFPQFLKDHPLPGETVAASSSL